MKRKYSTFNYIFYSIAFFILLPNKIKELPFVMLAIFSTVIFIREKKINIKKFLFLTSFFCLNLLSLMYSDDLKNGIHRIEGLLPFLYITFSYLVFSEMEIKFEKKFVYNWIFIFNISNFIFILLYWGFFYFLNLNLSYNNIRTVLDQIPLINMHPIYLSLTSVLGLMTCLFIFEDNIKKCLFFITINIGILIMSGAKSTLIGFLILLCLFILFSQIGKKAKFSIGLISLLSLYLLFAFNNDFRKRFREIILPVSYLKVDSNNSTSVRYAVWNCSLQQIKNSDIFLGNGIGDVPTILQQCYDTKYPELDKYYNTHNQYFSVILGTGILGLVSFLAFFIYLIIDGLKNKNKFLIILVVFYLYLFIFENIIERKYGILLLLFFLFFVFNIFVSTNLTFYKVSGTSNSSLNSSSNSE